MHGFTTFRRVFKTSPALFCINLYPDSRPSSTLAGPWSFLLLSFPFSSRPLNRETTTERVTRVILAGTRERFIAQVGFEALLDKGKFGIAESRLYNRGGIFGGSSWRLETR